MKNLEIFILAVFLSSFNGLMSIQVIEKTIENFSYGDLSPSSIYYISTVQGLCEINSKFENNVGFLVDYNFKSQSKYDFFEILMNYGTKTKSFACKTSFAISLKLKLDVASNSDVLKFMLIEDLNMNGEFDSEEDGIYAYTFELAKLSPFNNEWFELIMPYEKFELWYTASTNSFNKKLDLNKIRAWRITIFNNDDVKNQNKRILFKEIKISCQAVPLIEKYSPITAKSTFIQLWNDAGCACGLWPLSRWVEEIKKMVRAGINRLIVQYSVYHDHSWYNKAYGLDSTLDKIVKAAELQASFKVVFGLYFDENWNWQSKYDAKTYESLFVKHKKVIDDIYNLYGTFKSFGGFYIPQEWNNVEWRDSVSINLLAEWTKDVITYAKSKSNVHVPVIISPFFRNSVSLDYTARLYGQYLSIITNNHHKKAGETDVFLDELWLQDSFGVEESLRNSPFDLYNYGVLIKRICEVYGTKMGVTVEIFEQTTVNGEFAAIPANIDRVKKQTELSSYISTNLIHFEWGYMMANDYKLYNQYLNYLSL